MISASACLLLCVPGAIGLAMLVRSALFMKVERWDGRIIWLRRRRRSR